MKHARSPIARGVALSAALAVLGGAAACQLVAGIDSRSLAAEGSGTSDSGASDSGASDSGAPNDGAPDAMLRDAGALDGALPFCASVGASSMFCDAFDDESALLPRWSSVTGAAVTIDGLASSSPPNAVSIVVPKNSASCTRASANKSLTGAFRGSRLAFSARFGPATEYEREAVAVQEFKAGSSACALVFLLGPEASLFEQNFETLPDGGRSVLTGGGGAALQTLSPNDWHRFVIEFDRVASTVKMSIDGIVAVDVPLALSCLVGAVNADLRLGFNCAATRAFDEKVRFDDVTFDAW